MSNSSAKDRNGGAVSQLANLIPVVVSQLRSRDLYGAFATLSEAGAEGATAVDLFCDVLGPAQVEMGELWHRNEVTIADEHAATAIVESLLDLVAADADANVDLSAPRTVIVCAEGEWHTLPAKMLSKAFRSNGRPVTFIAGSVPPADLRSFLSADPPDLVAVSCSTAVSLPGAVVFTEISHDLGLPVMVGGSAFGDDRRRADAIGADLWAPDCRRAVELLAVDGIPSQLNRSSVDVGGALEYELARPIAVRSALAVIVAQTPAAHRDRPGWAARTAEALGFIHQHAEIADLLDDVTIFTDFVEWVRPMLDQRGVAANVFDDWLMAMLESVDIDPLRDVIRLGLVVG